MYKQAVRNIFLSVVQSSCTRLDVTLAVYVGEQWKLSWFSALRRTSNWSNCDVTYYNLNETSSVENSSRSFFVTMRFCSSRLKLRGRMAYRNQSYIYSLSLRMFNKDHHKNNTVIQTTSQWSALVTFFEVFTSCFPRQTRIRGCHTWNIIHILTKLHMVCGPLYANKIRDSENSTIRVDM